MKTKITLVIVSALILTYTSCDVINEATTAVITPPTVNQNNTPKLTNDEVVRGLKEALSVGIRNAVNTTGVPDGFLANPSIKIPFPQSAENMRTKALDWGLDTQVNQIVETLNRAAEDASKEAGPIFIKAIESMSITDGFNILNGGEGAATAYLKRTTTNELIQAFSPVVKESIDRVRLTEHWNPIMTRYNQATTFTGGEKVDTDLNAYVTERAVDGLFQVVEQEENKIRKDPAARVTDILAKVFGQQ